MKLIDPKEIIIELKEVIAERGLKPQEIVEMSEKAHTPVSLSSVRRICSEGSEDSNFDFKNIVMPLANLLLDIDKRVDDDSSEVSAMKELLLAKKEIIERQEKEISELKLQLAEEKIKHHDKLEKERGQFRRSLDFLKNQIELKDKRMDKLFDSVDGLMRKCDNCEFHNINKGGII